MNTIESVMKKVIERIVAGATYTEPCPKSRKEAERDMVVEDYKYAKIFVSSTYNQMWKLFGMEMIECVRQTHTHTHTHSPEIVSRGSIPDASEDSEAQDESDEEGSACYADDDEGEGDSGSQFDDGDQESDFESD